TEVIRFTASDKKASGGIEKTIVRKDIPAGEYEISEIPVSRYRLERITGVVSGSVSGSKVILDTDGQDAKATFVNRRESYQDYSDNDLVMNTFSK
ncbi:isopeptide-forming domain-containing fimbrial protein, partial [[Clostridium] innocuum]|nr:isopeptide-forming domain-containing fimbrial protein [[Clostridium] innocuum]MCI2984662.1 isopeptide-forming domain-containing fimbrial protein [[Clostridium] innocuum]MCR0197755.1 isopeptide-forming domain-containing fimbrial protein [[Clostridium] innocuum]MCR0210355.1 isopeptide-forming domain-containing fimbrial protein [[Clostridium] innocuum]MCR0244788.1 isopeptide-forming domain-containing fimbrial protein [[Clostridium] innocuum]